MASLPGEMPRYIHSFIYTCNSCISVHMAVRGIYLISRSCFIPDVLSYFLTIIHKKIPIVVLLGQFDYSLIPNLIERRNTNILCSIEFLKRHISQFMRPHREKVHLNSRQAINLVWCFIFDSLHLYQLYLSFSIHLHLPVRQLYFL